MSDIAFLLLIFIMLISLINYRKEVKIEYPEADLSEVTQADKNLELWIDSRGNLYFQGEPVNKADMEGWVAQSIAEDPSIRVHIIADKNTPYRDINFLVEMLQLLQHRVVSFVVKEEGK